MLTIEHFDAHYYLLDGLADRVATRRWLDRVAEHRVCSSLGEQVSQLPLNEGAVYCIRHLQLDLWINPDEMTETRLAHQWSQMIRMAVEHALRRGGPGNVVRYSSRAHYVAAFIMELVTGNPWAHWTFNPFADLSDLSVGRATAVTLAMRPHLLFEIINLLHERHIVERMIQVMNADDIGLLWINGFGFEDLPAVPAIEWQHRLEVLRYVTLQEGGQAGTARNTLRLFLMMQTDDRNTAALAQHLAWLHDIKGRISGSGWQAVATGALSADQLRSLLSQTEPIKNWLDALSVHPDGSTYLSELAMQLTQPPYDYATTTNLAGLALLLPVIRQENWQLESEALYQLLVTAAGHDMAPLAWNDPAPRLFAGLSPQEADAARAMVVLWPASSVADEHVNHTDAGGLASEVLRAFAQGLRGFSDSSMAYLCRQFIVLPGQITLTDETIDVRLERAPLGIVLQMAGRIGEQGRIPWLRDRLLTISLPNE